MIHEIKRQFLNPRIRDGSETPDYEKCIAISTSASIRKMIAPGILVIGSPFIVGVLFGVEAVAGLLAGTIVSGVQIAISMSNTGGAWDNCKKLIESGTMFYLHDKEVDLHTGAPLKVYLYKKSDAHKNAVVGDTVGDPLKDTSGPSINILIKLGAITSLVFGKFFSCSGGVFVPDARRFCSLSS